MADPGIKARALDSIYVKELADEAKSKQDREEAYNRELNMVWKRANVNPVDGLYHNPNGSREFYN